MSQAIEAVIERLRNTLIVSSQAMDPRSPLRQPEILSLMAQAAELGGAGGFRVDGAAVLRHLRPATRLPIIGIVKDRREGFDNYITTSAEDIDALADAGADIVAIQATSGTRPGPAFAELAVVAHRRGLAVMADISSYEEARSAVADGADLVATTMVGFTAASEGVARPPLQLVRHLLALAVPVVVEGGVWTPEHLRASLDSGAHAVVSGSAITAPDLIVRHLLEGAGLAR